METSRRGFMQLGAFGATALTLGSTTAMLTGCSSQNTPAEGFKTLRDVDVYFLGALAPAVLTTKGYPSALDKEARTRLLHALDTTMTTLQGHALKQLQMAFDLMGSPVTRIAVGAPWHPWQEATVEEAEDFLESWRGSSMAIKRMGYAGLTKLIKICWYSQPENYALSGYPGPPIKVPFPYPAATEK
jgi:hypothetical protein